MKEAQRRTVCRAAERTHGVSPPPALRKNAAKPEIHGGFALAHCWAHTKRKYKEIADQLSLSYHTVDTHLRNIYAKLHVNTRSGAVAKALKERLF